MTRSERRVTVARLDLCDASPDVRDESVTARNGFAAARALLAAVRDAINAFCALVLHWWRADRVRVSRRGGQLLRLRPPCLLQIKGRIVEVTERTAGRDADGPFLLYRCRDAGHLCQLRIDRIAAGRRPRVCWRSARGVESLLPGEITVLGRT